MIKQCNKKGFIKDSLCDGNTVVRMKSKGCLGSKYLLNAEKDRESKKDLNDFIKQLNEQSEYYG